MEMKEKTYTIIGPYGTPSMRGCPESRVKEMIAYFNRVMFPDRPYCFKVEEKSQKSS